jgi:hypothetical protein
MWDKLKIRERERRLGLLFLGVMPAIAGVGLLASSCPLAAEVVTVGLLGILWLAAMRRIIALRQSRYDPAPVGPLSPDERIKARSKLLGAGPPRLRLR